MKEIAENAAAAAHCALHLDCFKTFPHHDIPSVSHCTLCTAPSLQHSWPAAEVGETALSPPLSLSRGKLVKSYSGAKDTFLIFTFPMPTVYFQYSMSLDKEDH